MGQQDINKDLGSYLSERKGKPFWKKNDIKKIHPKHRDEEMDMAIQQELKHDFEQAGAREEEYIAPEDKKDLEAMEEKIIEASKEEKDVDEKQENILKKFFKKLNFSDKNREEKERQYEGVQMSNNPEITMDDEEMRELLHGLHNWIIQLPADKLERFKSSREFELYTKYLRKHNLIK